MDIIIENHDSKNLEKLYENHHLFSNDDFSIMCQSTEIPWLQLIPNRTLDDPDYIAMIYKTLYRLGEHLKKEGLGEHYNIAKIGNKLPYYHIHLVMRAQGDECWPEAIWGGHRLKSSPNIHHQLKILVENFFQ